MRFRHAAIVGKYQARGIRPVLEEVAHFLIDQGLDVCFDRDTATATGVADYEALSTAEIGKRCDLAERPRGWRLRRRGKRCQWHGGARGAAER